VLAPLVACSSDPQPATGPVDVPVPEAAPAVAEVCAALVAALPDEVDPGVTRRPVTGDERRTAAYGDPPVTLECGVPDPDRPDDEVSINGVSWTVRDIGAGFRWTTLGRVANVAVTIPDTYENGGELVLPLAEPVQQNVPLR
jgi:hypothetical protein